MQWLRIRAEMEGDLGLASPALDPPVARTCTRGGARYYAPIELERAMALRSRADGPIYPPTAGRSMGASAVAQWRPSLP